MSVKNRMSDYYWISPKYNSLSDWHLQNRPIQPIFRRYNPLNPIMLQNRYSDLFRDNHSGTIPIVA